MYRPAPLVQPGDKYCFRCASVKPLSAFYIARSKPDGRDSRCKECAKEAGRNSRATRKRIEEAYRRFRGSDGRLRIDLASVDLEAPWGPPRR